MRVLVRIKGSFKALLRLCYGSLKAMLRECVCGSTGAYLRLV